MVVTAISSFVSEMAVITMDIAMEKAKYCTSSHETRDCSSLSHADLNCSPAQSRVLVIGATSSPDSLDPGLRRAGRFDREISLGIPDQQARERCSNY